jgi:hypothetical protein
VSPSGRRRGRPRSALARAGIDERERGVIEDEEPRVAVCRGGGRQLRDRGSRSPLTTTVATASSRCTVTSKGR